MFNYVKKRAWLDSNQRPLVPETNTLSSELQAHGNIISEILLTKKYYHYD